MAMLWWHWMVIGMVLCLAELFIPALVLVWLGIAAVIIGGITFFVSTSLTLQVFLWALLSTLLTFLWLKVFKARTGDSRAGSSSEMLGETGLMVKAAEPFSRGEILFQRPLFGSDRWACSAEVQVPAGSRARVIGVEGNTLKVEKA